MSCLSATLMLISHAQFLYISTAFYTPAAFCTKVTLLLLIARVFSVHPTVATGIRIFIVLIFLAYVPIAFLKIFVCKPITAYWDDYDTDSNGMADGQNGNCRGQATLFMGDIMISVITDVLILLLPIPLAWRMEAPRWQKIKIVFLLGAGGAATVTTVFRAWLNVQFMHTTSTFPGFRPRPSRFILTGPACEVTPAMLFSEVCLTDVDCYSDVTLDFGLSCVTS